MVNERKTEDIIRDILKRNKEIYEKETKQSVIIEEQKSDNPRIAKLLLTASKAGLGVGKPEFIISFSHSNLLIVIECKAEPSHQRSKNLDKPKDYAVDGALLYSSYLSKEFDVIAIGASGETAKDLLVDTFIQINKEPTARELSINKVYTFGDYLTILKKDDVKEHGDFKKLMEYSNVLSHELRDNFDFVDNLKPLVVSGILLALEDAGFIASYQKKITPLELADLIITTVRERLERDNIKGTKLTTIVETYGFLRTNTQIIMETDKEGKPNTLLRDLIREIEINVKPFLQDYKQYDVIGMFYNEFLRYANGDGGLGIVLTPRHITELFVQLAEVNKDSVIMDNCCGTGGFLISAMKKMEDEVKGDSTKLKAIHTKQLLGIEKNAVMFCLACSNMMLRGDGKSNINQADCFETREEEIKKFKPSIGFLNPPYSKENGHKELKFIDNCLSFLEPQATCIAIVPQSCAMNTKKGYSEAKRKLLANHTLRAVMSMPNTLFDDSDTSAVTCILVFEAHKPHSETTKTWFGYWKNDGFIKVRPYGRVDWFGKYAKNIRPMWLDTYFGKKEIDGYSILRHVGADDEWLVEPYIRTRFESVTDEDFEATLRDYNTFLYSTGLKSKVSNESYADRHLKLDFTKWKEVMLGGEKGLFTVKGSKTMDKKVLDEEHRLKDKKYPYVTTQATNNGIRDFYDICTDDGNILTIDSAVVGYCAYQPLNFSASDHVEKLIPQFELNAFRGLFIATIINREQYRYSYGRKFNQDRIKETVIKLPFKNGEIDWDFIEDYMKGLKHSKHIEL